MYSTPFRLHPVAVADRLLARRGALIASSGSATSISFFRPVMLWLLGIGSVSQRRVRQRSGRSGHFGLRQPASWMIADRLESMEYSVPRSATSASRRGGTGRPQTGPA